MSQYNKISCEIKVTNPGGDFVKFFECISVTVDSSYDTVTDTAKVVLPKHNRWIVKDTSGLNTYVLMDSDGFTQRGLFRPGDSIEIKLGYDFNNALVFQGYVTGIDPKRPFALLCEDAAWLLKRKKISLSLRGPRNKLSDFIDQLLDGTGVSLHSVVKPEQITFGKIRFNNVTVAQILNEWKKDGLISYIRDGQLVVGRSFFSNSANILRSSEAPDYTPPTYNLEYDVPADNGDQLILNTIDKRAVAVRAVSRHQNNKSLTMTVVLHPEEMDDRLIVVQEADTRKTQEEVREDAQRIERDLNNTTINLDQYQTRTLHYYGLERDELLENVMGDFFKIVDTGFGGHFIAFGDNNLQPATTLYVIDPTNTEKNGEFIIKSVHKTFGQDGYWQTVQIPHKFKNYG
ncbi:MAG: hypothetical protein AAF620_00265 [Bacteroidota bacterium]